MCIRDRIWAWEFKAYDPTLWWNQVPLEVRAKLHFYNTRVDGGWKSDASALRTIVATANPEDFVVVKVDIDTSHSTELDIVRAIADNPVLTRLVDEVYFEYHFLADNLTIGWQTQNWNQSEIHYTTDTVDDALGLMQRLRRRGVRSHFWV